MTQLRSNIEWKQWGKDDPFWGVASLPSKQRDGESPWTNDEFYDHGNSNWQDFFAQWQHYGVNRRKLSGSRMWGRAHHTSIGRRFRSCLRRGRIGGYDRLRSHQNRYEECRVYPR
jgi:hypothetical protein